MPRDTFEPLTRCGRDTSMGRLLREFWTPALPGSALEADGAPYRLKLLGEHLVAFRDTNGRVGILDEACPHRGASLVLGRNEECGLRCLYHGWKLDVEGNVVDTPRERNRVYGARLPAMGYPTEERAGMIWTYLGSRRPAPPLPEYPWMSLPDSQVGVICVPIHANWLLGLEATWDPTHVPVLHQSSINPAASVTKTVLNIPAYEPFDVDRMPYGARLAQLYPNDDHSTSVRMKEYLFPYMRMNPQTADEDSDIVVFVMVPVDDENMMFWFILYNHDHPTEEVGFPIQARGPTGIRELPYGRESNWGQDRQAMKHHFTGLSLDEPALGVIVEDLVMLESMSETLDRTKHHLTPADGMVVKARWVMKTMLEEYERDGTVPDITPAFTLRPRFLVIPKNESWRDHYPKKAADVLA